jgi:hypothetical protein
MRSLSKVVLYGLLFFSMDYSIMWLYGGQYFSLTRLLYGYMAINKKFSNHRATNIIFYTPEDSCAGDGQAVPML